MSYRKYRPNGEQLRYRDPLVANPPFAEDQREEEEEDNGEFIPMDAYSGFVNAFPGDPNLQVDTSYSEGLNRNSSIMPLNQQSVPPINVIQRTPDVIGNPYLDQRNQIDVNPGSEYFDDEDYYYGTSHGNHSGSSRGSNTSLEDVGNLSERPILRQKAKDNMNFVFNDDPMTMNVHQRDSEDGSDLEDGYIDQRGDDYQINTFLGRNGEMVDPYSQRLSSLQSDFYSNEELVDDTENSHNLDEHKDLGDYDGSKNSDRVAHFRTLSTISSNDVSKDGEKAEGATLSAIPKRSATMVRKFRLWRGNFVFDSPISESLLKKYVSVSREKISNEFKFMRYQAVTCEPDEMEENKFTVRQLNYIVPRETELMIVITMYNEDHILLGRTLKGVMDNVRHMVRKKRSSTWGADAWKKIVVCVISDGRAKVNEKALALMSALGCYQDGFAKDEINDNKVKMHVYEHTTMMNITHVSEKELRLESNANSVPVQLMFGLKETNLKKINSHRWAFEGFAELLQPNVVTLLDAGTMPGKKSIYQLWREFRNSQVGGACGEIKVDLGRGYKKLFNPLVAAQNFEYKMSNILDKTLESDFGFITVLPGAFSAYRFEAVKGVPLQKYFYGEKVDEKKFNFFTSNMYLAEDRILCFEVVTKKGANWILKYCRGSSASTDVPERVPEFILQRRRWLNGSFFAGIYSSFHFYRIWTSGHNIIRKLLLSIEFVYLFLNTVLSWFSLSSFFLVFRILTMSIALSYDTIVFNILCVVFYWIYGFCIVSTFILSLGNRPKTTEWFYLATCIFFAILMAYMIFCSVWMAVKSFEHIFGQKVTFVGLITEEAFRDLVISLGSTICLYAASSVVYLQPWHMFTSFLQYVLLTPSYVNVLNIYAFCNVHDLSWGTKGSAAKPLGKIQAKEDGTFNMEIPVSSQQIQLNYNKYIAVLARGDDEEANSNNIPDDERKAGYYAKVRSLVIIVWLLMNFGVCAAVMEYGGIADYLAMRDKAVTDTNNVSKGHERPVITKKATIYFSIILWIVAFSAAIRFVGCVIYMLSRLLRKLTFR